MKLYVVIGNGTTSKFNCYGWLPWIRTRTYCRTCSYWRHSRYQDTHCFPSPGVNPCWGCYIRYVYTFPGCRSAVAAVAGLENFLPATWIGSFEIKSIIKMNEKVLILLINRSKFFKNHNFLFTIGMHWRIGGSARDVHSPLRPKFLHFHAVFRKIVK